MDYAIYEYIDRTGNTTYLGYAHVAFDWGRTAAHTEGIIEATDAHARRVLGAVLRRMAEGGQAKDTVEIKGRTFYIKSYYR